MSYWEWCEKIVDNGIGMEVSLSQTDSCCLELYNERFVFADQIPAVYRHAKNNRFEQAGEILSYAKDFRHVVWAEMYFSVITDGAR